MASFQEATKMYSESDSIYRLCDHVEPFPVLYYMFKPHNSTILWPMEVPNTRQDLQMHADSEGRSQGFSIQHNHRDFFDFVTQS